MEGKCQSLQISHTHIIPSILLPSYATFLVEVSLGGEFSTSLVIINCNMLKGKKMLKLDEILSSDDETINEEAINFYMVKQYAGYCEYLNECLSDLNKEYEEIAL